QCGPGDKLCCFGTRETGGVAEDGCAGRRTHRAPETKLSVW
ncbi:unnamed protein product, partial [Pylaiella littoralis]